MQTFAPWRIVALLLASVAVALPQSEPSTKPPGPAGDARRWSSWRGPLGTGSAASGSPPTQWAEETEQSAARNIAWKVKVPGLGISSPIVWQDRIYLTTAIETSRPGKAGDDLPPQDHRSAPRASVVHEFAVVCLNRGDGSLIWQKKLVEGVPHEGGHLTNSHASGSPVTDGEYIYASFGSRGLYCLNRAGEVVWSKKLGVMRTRRQYGEGSSPALYGDRLIVNWDHEGDSFLVILDKRTGKELWRQPREEVTSWSTPIVVQVRGRPQIVVNATAASRGYDLKSGEVIWSLSGMTVNCIPIPIHADGVVYLMSGYRGQMLQAVQLEDARGDLEGSRHVLWTHRRNTSYVPSGALYHGRLYFLRGNNAVLSCLDSKTGEVLYEGQRLHGLRTIYASPVCADGRIYVTSRDGVTMVIGHGPTFKQLTVNRLDDAIDASMAIVGDEIYVRGRRHMYCIAERRPAQVRPSEGEHKARERDSGKAEEPAGQHAVGPFSYRRTGSLGAAADRTASISIGDVDSDGDLDLVVANGRHWAGQNKIFLNDGKGTFGDEHKLSSDLSTTYAAALADLDGDGDLDAVVGNDRAPSYVFMNNGKGRFVRGPQVGKISNTRSVTLADLDGQHGIDVILTNRREANLICFNDGEGGFGRQSTFGSRTDATINVATGDVDGDGDLDIAVANRNGQQNHVYLNDGKGGFSRSVPYGTGSDATRGVALADIDGDGHLDILNANIGQPNAVYFGNGSGRFDRSITFGGDSQSYALAPSDMNGDGRIDIVVANVRGPNAIYLQSADRSFRKIPFGASDGMTYGLVVADWNGDGHPEIATANSDGQNNLYQWVRR
ncbi:MAG: VCBS repeat-containing protein [Planctomycetes bacterium]|nr:VCBS repeat-containing protein [Planctomycetota bacterium]